MADETQVRTLTLRDLHSKTPGEKLAENLENTRIRQLVVLQIYHERKLKKIKEELEMIVGPDADNVDY